MNAVAAAVTLSEIYHDELWVKVAAYSYAVVLSYGMTFCDHWVSDVLAGWLLGYGIGKTIGASFSPLTSPKESALSLDIRPNYVGVKVSI
jgi:presenilin-like A22 family membrane protease